MGRVKSSEPSGKEKTSTSLLRLGRVIRSTNPSTSSTEAMVHPVKRNPAAIDVAGRTSTSCWTIPGTERANGFSSPNRWSIVDDIQKGQRHRHLRMRQQVLYSNIVEEATLIKGSLRRAELKFSGSRSVIAAVAPAPIPSSVKESSVPKAFFGSSRPLAATCVARSTMSAEQISKFDFLPYHRRFSIVIRLILRTAAMEIGAISPCQWRKPFCQDDCRRALPRSFSPLDTAQ